MTLIEQINSDKIAAYKNKEMEKKDFLGVLATEVTKESKTPEDSHVVAKIKSMIKNAEATSSLSNVELEILEKYLPIQMSEADLTIIISNEIDANGYDNMKDMGNIMAFLKTNHAGTYDGKMASTIVKQLLS